MYMKFYDYLTIFLNASLFLLLLGCDEEAEISMIDFGKKTVKNEHYPIELKTKSFNHFSQNSILKIRQDLLLDGIEAPAVELKIALPIGKYKIISFLEAGLTDSTYLKFFINDEEQKFNWQSFAPQAEPRESIQEVYRIISSNVISESGSVVLKYDGINDSVRLLALRVFKNNDVMLQPDDKLKNALSQIGNYKFKNDTRTIDNIINSIDGDENYIAYWRYVLITFKTAIDLFNEIGWEKGNEIYDLNIFARLHQCVMLLDGIIDDQIASQYIGENARWIRGRVLWWLNKERGGRDENLSAMNDINYLVQRHPGDELIRMYAGEKIDQADSLDSIYISPNAPLWSKLQREAIARLSSEIDWWVNVRQADNGELGGKIDDDVELLRWWSALTTFGDTNAIKGWKKLAEAVWSNPKVYKGYSKNPIDVEHSAEFISDAFPEMVYFTENTADEFLRPSADYFVNLWTFKNSNGRRFFKSSWFSSTEVITDSPKDRDLAMNTRASKAVRFYAWKANDQIFKNALYEWSSAWYEMAMRMDKEKPLGLFPASVRGIDEEFNGDGVNWYDADMYWTYYNWEHSGGVSFYDQLLYSYLTHKDKRLLEPLWHTLRMIDKNKKVKSSAKGSPSWAAGILTEDHGFWNTLLQYRIFTGDHSFDKLLNNHGNPYSKYLLTNNEKYLIEGLNLLLNDIRYNVPLRTTEVIHTDRVRTGDIITLKGMLTGNDSYELESPFLWVTYENTNNRLTPLVTFVSPQKINISLFYHSTGEIEPTIRLWNLEKGQYLLKVFDEFKNVVSEKKFEYKNEGTRISIKIDGEHLFNINIEKNN